MLTKPHPWVLQILQNSAEEWCLLESSCVDLKLLAQRFKSTVKVCAYFENERLMHTLDSLFIILTLQGLFLFEGYTVWDVFVPTQHVSWQTTLY